MSPVVAEKPHAVFIPFPAQGHVTPMMQLAMLLHSRGFYITFVNTEFNHSRLVRSKGLEGIKGLTDFRLETIPDGLPPSDLDANKDTESLGLSVQRNCLAPLLNLLIKLISSSEVPRVSCIVSDTIMSCGTKAAEELGIPKVQFWTASACGFMAFLHLPELIQRGIIPLKDEDAIDNGYLDIPIDWIPGMKDIRLKDLPSMIRTTNPNDIELNFLVEEAQNCLSTSTIIFNTFDDLESEVLGAIACKIPDIYTIGSISMIGQHILESKMKSIRSNLWKEDTKCLKWLDKMEPNSVLYVNFGSTVVMTSQHLIELAWGLANSMCPFLWIIRPDVVLGKLAISLEEFIEETKDRGLITSWCPQEQVLSHSSVGGFLTHCGWNSTMESICAGKPLLCWPLFAEQHTNCRYACTTWGIGMEINDKHVKCDEIETLIKELMEGEKGKKMRNKVLEWKEKAGEATILGGSSYNNFEKLVGEVLQPCMSASNLTDTREGPN